MVSVVIVFVGGFVVRCLGGVGTSSWRQLCREEVWDVEWLEVNQEENKIWNVKNKKKKIIKKKKSGEFFLF